MVELESCPCAKELDSLFWVSRANLVPLATNEVVDSAEPE